MKTEDFNRNVDLIIADVTGKIKVSKAKEYTSDDDRLWNGRRIAERKGVDPYQAFDYLKEKHTVSIESMFKDLQDGKTFTMEYMLEKCGDEIAYLVIMFNRLVEMNEANKPQMANQLIEKVLTYSEAPSEGLAVDEYLRIQQETREAAIAMGVINEIHS